MTDSDQPSPSSPPPTRARRLYPATPTRLTTWLDCARRYRFTYLDRPAPPKGPPWAHNSLGASVHLALAEWWRLPLERRTPTAGGDVLERGWLSAGFRDDGQSLLWRRRARDMVERYVEHLDPADEPRGIERTVALKHGGTALSGRVDRIDERTAGGVAEQGVELVVVDYKTGRHLLSVDDARTSLALAVYAAGAARTLRGRCVRVELHHLPSGEVVTWEHTEATLNRHLGRADAIAAECAEADARFKTGLRPDAVDEVFPPSPSSWCGWCDFIRLCPEGQAAARARRPWDGLATD